MLLFFVGDDHDITGRGMQYRSVDGCSSWTVTETDGTNWYVTVYENGSSNQSWPCVWTQVGQYSWAWEPPGCPAVHTFYVTSQIDGVGPNHALWGRTSPAQFVNYSYTVAHSYDGLTHNISAGISTVCNLIGGFFNTLFGLVVRVGHSVFEYTNTGTMYTCNVRPLCTNNRPWIVDGQSVKLLSPQNPCYPYWTCWGVCIRDPGTFTWRCPQWGVVNMSYCFPEINAIEPQECTPHP
jgi:hypothetical protein